MSGPCSAPEIRPSRAGRRRALVLVLVHLAIAAHIGIWLASGKAATLSPVEPSEAEVLARDSIVNTGVVFFALTILSTMVLGRWFCGWACHLVALQDACRWLLLRVGIRPRRLRSRWMAVVPLIAALYLFVWPIVPRLMAGEDVGVRGTEFFREGFWDTFPPWIPAIVTFIVCGGLAVYLLGSKGFCTYGCPYGAFYGLADRVAPGRIRVTDACVQCGHCTAVCTSDVNVSQEVHSYGMVVDPGCMKCFDCVSVCPEGALYFGFGKPAVGARPKAKAPRRLRMPTGEEPLAALACVYAFFAMRGFNQGSGLLLNVGVATCFAALAVASHRVFRRRDASLPGLALKRGGAVRPAGMAVVAVTLAISAAAWPFGIAPERAAWRARALFLETEPLLDEWMGAALTYGLDDVAAEDRERGGELFFASQAVRDGSWVRTTYNSARLGWGLLLVGDSENAISPLRDAAAAGESDPRLYTLLGDAVARAGGDPLAEWYRALKLDPGHLPTVQRVAEAQRRAAVGRPGDSGPAEEALRVIDAALDARPDAVELYEPRGLFRASLGDLEGATDDLLRLVEARPRLLGVRLAAAEALAAQGRLPEAHDLLEGAEGEERSDARWSGLRAAVLEALGGSARD